MKTVGKCNRVDKNIEKNYKNINSLAFLYAEFPKSDCAMRTESSPATTKIKAPIMSEFSFI